MTAPAAALNDLQKSARAYLDRGWVVLVLPYRTKHRLPEGWPDLRLTAKQCDRILASGRHNLGVHLGPPSGQLADIDLDTEQARRLAQTPGWLPRTPAVFGRRGAPRSHWLYVSPDGPAEATDGLKHQAVEGADVVTHVELRWGPGWQTIFPGSAHDATGEAIVWMPTPGDDGSDAFADRRPESWDVPSPAIAGWQELLRAAGRIAAGSLLARRWPDFRRRRLRNRVLLGLAGALLRDPAWTAEGLWDFLRPVLEVSGAEDEYPVRWGTIKKTAKNLAAGNKCVGWNELLEQGHLTSEDVDLLKAWLQLAPAPDAVAAEIAAHNAGRVNGRAPPISQGASQSSGGAAAAGAGAAAQARAASPPKAAPAGGRVLVEIPGDDLYGNSRAILEGVRLASQHDPVLFAYGGALARLNETSSAPDDAPVIETLTTESLLLNQLARMLDFRIADGRQNLLPATPRTVLVRNLLATPASAWPVPALSRVVDTPVMTADGRLLWTPGYDAPSGVYVALAPELRGLRFPPAPTRADAEAAVADLLDGVWAYFPFRDAADKANALAGALTPILRPLIDGPTPLHAVIAPTPGTGKSFLARSIARPFTGDRITEWTPSVSAREEEGLRKEITTFLKAGHSAFLFDNIGGALDNKVLAGALTRRRWTDRLLGGNQTGAYAIDVLWLVASNNPSFSGELARRTVPIVLRSVRGDPTQRPDIPAEHQGEEWLVAQRRRQVEALLALVAWWRAQPPSVYRGPVLGGFEAWSRTVGAVFQCSGVRGFLANVDDFRARESELEAELGALVEAWKAKYGDTPVTVEELLPNVVLFLDLHDRLTSGRANPKHALGLLLRDVRGRVIADVRIACERRITGGRRKWVLVAPDAPDP